MAEELNKNLQVTDLDFDSIKESLKSYLQGQDLFKDYNFEGSGLNYLLDVLAYNTHYQSFYTNMVANETFLDTAIRRDSVVSIAKHLGYTPNSVRSPFAIVNISGDEAFTLDAGTVFTSSVAGESYTFVTKENITSKVSGGVYIAENVSIYEGEFSTLSFVVNSNNRNQRFILPENTDTSTLTVRVANSITDSTGLSTKWQLASNLNEVKSTDKVYHLQETDNGRFEIYFGDNIVGVKPANGNVIVCQFVLTRNPDANGIGSNDTETRRSFTLEGFDVRTIAASAGGANPESIRSIKFNAPRNYQAQDRAVTQNDFATMILRDFPDIETAVVWGGQDNDPPIYGKVFIALKPKTGISLDTPTKQLIIDSLKRNRSIVSVIPEILDPDPLYLLFDARVVFDQSRTTQTPNGIRSFALSQIRNYVDTDLEKFDGDLYYSKLLGLIDDISDSVVGTELRIRIQKHLTPTLNTTSNYSLNFNNEVFHPNDGYQTPVVSSTGFDYKDDNNTVFRGFLEDDGSGNIRIFKVNDLGVKTVVYTNVGSIDYKKGRLSLLNFRPLAIVGTVIRITVMPKNQNIYANENQLLTLDVTDSESLQVVAVTTLQEKNMQLNNRILGNGSIITGV
jgi:hypothetical protein